MAIGSYLKSSFLNLKNGSTMMITNHKRCNAIRRKHKDAISAIQSSLTPEQWKEHPLSSRRRGRGRNVLTGISFEEYNFLQRGKEDRGKLGNLIFIMVASPNLFPYYLMFFPKQLPSPFVNQNSNNNNDNMSEWNRMSKERGRNVLLTLLDIERESYMPNVSFLSNLIPFGKGKKMTKMMKDMTRVGSQLGDLLLNEECRGKDGCGMIMNMMEHDLYRVEEEEVDVDGKTKKKDRKKEKERKDEWNLMNVPKSIIKGVNRGLDGSSSGGGGGGASPFSSLTPNFMIRGKVMNHLKKLMDADEFLVDENIDIGNMEEELLYQACNDRMIGCYYKDNEGANNDHQEEDDDESTNESKNKNLDEMRIRLSNWLDATVREPRLKMERDGDEKSGRIIHFNDNLARLALMCYHVVDSTRDEQTSSLLLPRLLYQS